MQVSVQSTTSSLVQGALPSQSNEASHAVHPKAGVSSFLDKSHYLLCLEPIELITERAAPCSKAGNQRMLSQNPLKSGGLGVPSEEEEPALHFSRRKGELSTVAPSASSSALLLPSSMSSHQQTSAEGGGGCFVIKS